MNLVEKAKKFATECHESQFRNDGETPYISHPEAVVEYLKQIGVDDEIILASAWLHDVMEDCDVDYVTLYKEFGLDVAEIVNKLTFEPSNRKSNKFQKDLYLAEIAASGDIKTILIKCADRLHNTWCFIKSGKTVYARKYFFKAGCIFGSVKRKADTCHLNISLQSQKERDWCYKMFEEVKAMEAMLNG